MTKTRIKTPPRYKFVRVPEPLWLRASRRRKVDSDLSTTGVSVARAITVLIQEALDAREQKTT